MISRDVKVWIYELLHALDELSLFFDRLQLHGISPEHSVAHWCSSPTPTVSIGAPEVRSSLAPNSSLASPNSAMILWRYMEVEK